MTRKREEEIMLLALRGAGVAESAEVLAAVRQGLRTIRCEKYEERCKAREAFRRMAARHSSEKQKGGKDNAGAEETAC